MKITCSGGPDGPGQDRQDEADPGERTDQGQEPALRGRLDRPGNSAAGDRRVPVPLITFLVV